ncbi:MAG: Gldg family protein [Alphaproteobacteria bacterium]|nr:Gldg family protein [Alphaproteobacteria bacterium]
MVSTEHETTGTPMIGRGVHADPGRLTGVALALLAALFVAVNVLAAFTLSGLRLDLTEDRLYSLSPASESVLAAIEEPVTLRLYYSKRLGAQAPQYGVYAERVQDVLREYEQRAGGKIRLEIYDPEPFTPVEDRAVAFGLQALSLEEAGGSVFFGLVGSNTTDDVENIPFLQPDREAFLEYDLTKMVFSLSKGTVGKVGVLGSMKVDGDIQMGQRGRPEQTPPLVVTAQVRDLLDLTVLDNNIQKIPDDISILWIVQPKKLPKHTVFAIDQYLLGGGKAVVFVDPYAESEGPQSVALAQIVGTDGPLKPLFDAWGLEMPADVVVGDRFAARRIGNSAGNGYITYVPWLLMRGPNLNKESPITAQIDSVAVASAGHLLLREGSSVTLDPLLVSSPGSMLIDVKKVATERPQPEALLSAYQPGPDRYTVAGLLTGRVKTAFPDGRPPLPEDVEADPTATFEVIRTESDGPIEVIVVADTDVLLDRFWVQYANIGGRRVAVPGAGNGAFVANAFDTLTGSSALLELRGLGSSYRPFDVIEQLRREADRAFQSKEQTLSKTLAETQKKLAALRGEGAGTRGPAALSEEEQGTVRKLQNDVLRLRSELRGVRASLREDVERLESKVMFVNIAAMPILVAVFALGLAVWRAGRRRRRFNVAEG